MSTTVEAVEEHLESDPPVADVLSRDLISLRKTARWLIGIYGWETTEEAVVSALRRYRDRGVKESIWDARSTLGEARIELRDGLVLFTVPRIPEVQRETFETWVEEDGVGFLAILPGKTHMGLLVEEGMVDEIREALGPRVVENVVAPIGVVRLLLPGESEAALLSLVLTAIAQQGIKLLEVVSSQGEWILVFHDSQVLDAHRTCSSLIKKAAP